MDEFINSEEYRGEVSSLQHEINKLNNVVRAQRDELISLKTTNPDDPFENPTDYTDYSGSYTKILPQLGTPGYKLPLDPDASERKKIRRFYSIAGTCMIGLIIVSFALSLILIELSLGFVRLKNPDISRDTAYDYMYGSSILVAINMLVYVVCNVVFGFAGLKWAGVKSETLIKTKDFTFGRAIQYFIIGVFLWTTSVYLGTFIEMFLNHFNITCMVDQEGLGETPLAIAIDTLYACILAPVTEELFFRGMILKLFSKANQRFAVFASAFFFGFAHGNVAQFILGFIVGIFLAHLTMRHKSIIPAITVHMFINTFSTVFSYIGDISDTASTIATMSLFVLSILGILMLVLFRSANGGIPSTTPAQSRRGLYIALGSVPFIISLLMMVSEMVMNISSLE